MSEAQCQMPKYRCHKEVWALKIKDIVNGDTLVFDDPLFANREVGAEWIEKRGAKPEGYFVQYDNGYTSWSPADAFEGGYSLIE